VHGRFRSGDHLQVRRPLFYNHHGIYVSDDRVIQFGGGVFDKPNAKIEAVSLKEFERDGTAEVVRHGRRTLLSGYLFEADEPWKIVARAEFLLKLQPKLRYNLIGHNCEHIANMCVTGGNTESHQIRSLFGLRSYLTIALLWSSYLFGAKRAPSKRVWIGLLVSAGIGTGATTVYHHQIKTFWQQIRADWRTHERMLAEDPRNGLT
jgi:hypothetical protein